MSVSITVTQVYVSHRLNSTATSVPHVQHILTMVMALPLWKNDLNDLIFGGAWVNINN